MPRHRHRAHDQSRAIGDTVKVGYLHPAQEDFAGAYICLLSEGVSALDFTAIPYARIPSPAFPMDADMTWSSERGIMAPAGEVSV